MPEVIPVGGPATWTVSHFPAANTQATITKAAAGTGHRNVMTGMLVKFVGGAVAPAAKTMSVALIDGASGGTTYLLGPIAISGPGVAGFDTGFVVSGWWIPGTPNTAMTLEFSGQGGANTVESVTLSGTIDVG